MKILVIGSRDHDRAYCVDWLQPFPNIEDYDVIIIDLQSLAQGIYDKIKTKITGMNESITTVFNTDREIFCIMDKLIRPSPEPKRGTGEGLSSLPIIIPLRSHTNYDWFLIGITISNKKKGSSINIINHRFDRYFQYVDEWKYEISQSSRTQQDVIQSLSYGFVPIAENKSRKMIGASLKHLLLFQIDPKQKGAIHLLPSPTKCDVYQGIEILLDLVCGEREKIIPLWRKDIEVPEIMELEKKIEKRINTIKEIQQEISQLRGQIQEWDSYRDLLTATGDDLEKIVQKTLSDIGINTKKTEKGFPADLISNEVAVEITGIKGSVGVGSEKVIQTGRFKELYHKGEKIILIANTYVDLSLKARKGKINFSPEVLKYFESLSVNCLTTLTLFQLWKDVVTKKKDPKNVARKILTKKGELTLSEFE